MEFTRVVKEVKTHGSGKRNQGPPVPGRLADSVNLVGRMFARHPSSPVSVSGARLGSQRSKIQTDSKAGIRLRRISVRSSSRSSQAYNRKVACPEPKDLCWMLPFALSGR